MAPLCYRRTLKAFLSPLLLWSLLDSAGVIFPPPIARDYFCRMKSLFVVVVLTSILGLGQRLALAQNEQSTGARKVIRQVIPLYPFLARQMGLSGTVKLEALVTADGEVKTIQVKGGHPILAQSAQNAVRAWKWQKSDHETTESLEFSFKP